MLSQRDCPISMSNNNKWLIIIFITPIIEPPKDQFGCYEFWLVYSIPNDTCTNKLIVIQQTRRSSLLECREFKRSLSVNSVN